VRSVRPTTLAPLLIRPHRNFLRGNLPLLAHGRCGRCRNDSGHVLSLREVKPNGHHNPTEVLLSNSHRFARSFFAK
jgi:hypothetical protein